MTPAELPGRRRAGRHHVQLPSRRRAGGVRRREPLSRDVGALGALLSQGPVTPALAHLFTDSHGFGWLSEEDFVSHFAADVDPVKAKVMYAVPPAQT
jgi:hypothetical protein